MSKNQYPEDKFKAIVNAVYYWLGYQSKIGRQGLIHEASLRYPIADAITSKDTSADMIHLEVSHPIFKRRKIDLVIYKKSRTHSNSEKNESDIEEVYEFKLAKRNTSNVENEEHQRVFDDIARLAYYNKWENKNCYFLMCGTYLEFKSYFVGQNENTLFIENNRNLIKKRNLHSHKSNFINPSDKWESFGLYKDWFSFQIEHEKDINFNLNDSNAPLLKQFQENYFIRDDKQYKYEDKLSIKTTCLAITPAGDTNKAFAAGIWRIEGF